MRSAHRIPTARALAVPRPQLAVTNEWLATALLVALLVAALLVP